MTTNLSTSLSLTVGDEGGQDLIVHSSGIELIIPRDINLVLPPMALQNVSSIKADHTNNRQFNLHLVNITQQNPNISVSVHFQLRSLDPNLGYLVIYRFDDIPWLNSSINQTDGWSLLCPSNAGLFTVFIDNQQTSKHQTIIFGVRELNNPELTRHCLNESLTPPITDRPFNFSANYEVGTFTSGCFYSDSNRQWQSDGLLVGRSSLSQPLTHCSMILCFQVGPLTNEKQTQCFSAHFGAVAGGFHVLPAPINWNYVFANADFIKNKAIYFTMIIIALLYIALIVYARRKDRKDVERVRSRTHLHDRR